MSYLLDTCVISELIAKRPAPQVVEWIDGIADQRLYLSVITVGEIQRGIEKLPDPHRKQLAAWLHQDLRLRFDGRILPLDMDVLLTWGVLVAQMEQQGRMLSAMDSLIAALAIRHTLQLVTRNEKDFDGTGVSVVNPWR